MSNLQTDLLLVSNRGVLEIRRGIAEPKTPWRMRLLRTASAVYLLRVYAE
jgi:hypothetical protein